eukprot:CAMPEP_0181063594 /NCGR_PEP_ID=MMETSP1070-20121207/23729_1 /TAXON_ID=265543 /ORGANISM="Minutocellus polymorphus, Strain NH13" /LENGTH=71 /DNA_ID=CAMNT_0023143809 /DNA_START=376 /DNA_END=587 /DNA_ORIENTATION=+
MSQLGTLLQPVWLLVQKPHVALIVDVKPKLGSDDGELDGSLLGSEDGTSLGCTEGPKLGTTDGSDDGELDG